MGSSVASVPGLCILLTFKPTLKLETDSVGDKIVKRSFVVDDIDIPIVEVWLLNFYFVHLSVSLKNEDRLWL